MPRFLWDASNHDWTRGPMNLAKARAEGIDGFTHKASEGSTFTDPNFAQAMTRAKAAGFPVCGSYHVQWPNNPVEQADFWFSRVETFAPWWRQHPCWIWQIDAELFQNFKPYRQPTPTEINALGDRIVTLSRCKPTQVVVYPPEWLYGNTLGGLKYRNLWASNYVPGSGGFKQLYPGDGSPRWHDYSGITPTILQYTSGATIAGQTPADANAVRVNTIADMQALFLPADPPPDPIGDDDVKPLLVQDGTGTCWVIAPDLSSKTEITVDDFTKLKAAGLYVNPNPGIGQVTLVHIPDVTQRP